MKINKVDDKPVVIHTKAKAKIHSHKPREASIKGGNVYTVSKSSRIRGNSIADSVAYKNGAERIKAKARSQYRRSTVHSIDRDLIREIGIRRLRQNIRESNMPIKTAKTNLHIAGATATKTTVDQLEGGEEVMQASMLAYELSRPATGIASNGAELFKSRTIAEKRKRIKQVKAGRRLAKHSVKKVAGETAKEAAKESAKASSRIAAKLGIKTAGATIGSAAGPEGTVIGYLAGEAAGKAADQRIDRIDYAATRKSRMLKFFIDKMKAEGEQTDSVAKVVKDLVKGRLMAGTKNIVPKLMISFVSFLIVFSVITVPVAAVASAYYCFPAVFEIGDSGSEDDDTGNPAKCSLTEEEIEDILKDITDSKQKKAVSYALHRVGYPYSQDLRDTGDYYDCSSLAYYSWKSAGVDISHAGATTAAEEAKGLNEAGKTVSFSEMKPGDLIFYSYEYNGRYKNISHVAIYVGNGKLVEAQNPKNGVVFRDAKNSSSIVMIGRPS